MRESIAGLGKFCVVPVREWASRGQIPFGKRGSCWVEMGGCLDQGIAGTRFYWQVQR